ncbi:MAG: VWA domain-containing protein [Gammaproteobacteria bacterium]|nr:MAG: VWA domain-containing protein [Gammaproteobacteria bacterium]
MLQFEWPWLFALLPLPLLVRWMSRPADQAQAALRVPFLDDFSLPGSEHSIPHTDNRLWLMIAVLAWIALVSAATRPQWLGDPIELPIEGRDLMLAVDLSGSMEERDFDLHGRRVDRLTATKVVAGDFIDKRIGDRIGLILFGEQAYLQAPLTFDRQTVRQLLDEALINIAGPKTAIGDAIGLGVKRLRNKEGDRVIILLSDGENTAGAVDPLKAAELAASEGLKIYTIGIGSESAASNFFGMTVRRSGSGLDEKTLKQIAQHTGGRYFRARNTKELANIYELIDQMEPIESESRVYRPVDALYYWPLGTGIMMALIIMIAMSLGRIRA